MRRIMNRITKSLSLVLFVLFFQNSYSQMITSEKRIYLLDVTKSMIGRGSVNTPNIFDEVKKSLEDAVDDISDSRTEIVIIPFTDKPASNEEVVQGTIAQKDTLRMQIESLNVKSGNTNIADAWSKGIEYLDSTKVNYMFLLTDGLHNFGPDKEVLYERLRAWDTICDGKYFFSFYVMLTTNAIEQEIQQITRNTKQMWSIESLNINAALIKSSLVQRFNIFEDKTIGVEFSSNNPKVFLEDLNVQFDIEDNPYYSISPTRRSANNSKIYEFDVIEKTEKINIPIDVALKINVNHNDEKYPLVFFTPNEFEFKILNRGVRRMTLKVVDDEK